MFKSRKHIDDERQLAELIVELKRGSSEAFHVLYNKYQSRVYRFCLKMLADEAKAKDAFQETFFRVYENRKTFRGENFSSWLFTIARHTCLNHIRAKKDHEEYNEVFHSDAKFKNRDVALKEQIDKAISSLPVSLREALVLREYEECSYKEISEILGIELSLAKVRVHRARLLLRKLLKPIVKEINES